MLLCSAAAEPGTPQEQYYAGSAALSANDCKNALRYFQAIEDKYGNDPQFMLNYAKIKECLSDFQGALELYRSYARKAPGTPEIDSKIGAMMYAIDRQNAMLAEQQKRAAIADEQRKTEEAARRQQQEQQAKMDQWQACRSDCDDQRRECRRDALRAYCGGHSRDNCGDDNPEAADQAFSECQTELHQCERACPKPF
jgi:hypothetical protein